MIHRIKTSDLYGSPPGSLACWFNTVFGISIRADVIPPFKTYGCPVAHVGPVTPQMFETIELWVADLQRLSDRAVSAIVVCSVWRPAAPGRPTRHAEGRAIDIGGVWWDADDGVSAWHYGDRRRLGVAIEATMRLHFGTVLGPTANVSHLNHWHVDIGKPPAITVRELARSAKGHRMVEVVYIQEACSVVHGIPLVLDGIWGPRTMDGFSRVLRSMDYGPLPNITTPYVYDAFNAATAHVGFGAIEQVSRDT